MFLNNRLHFLLIVAAFWCFQCGLGQDDPKPPEKPTAEQTKSQELQNKIELAKTQVKQSEKRRAELAEAAKAAKQQLEDLRANGPTEQPPYSFLLVDRTRDELYAQQTRVKTAEASVEVTKAILDSNTAQLDAAQRAARLAKESLRGAQGDRLTELTNELKLAQLEIELYEATIKYDKSEVQNEKQSLAIAVLRNKLLEERVAKFETQVEFQQSDLDQMNAELVEVSEKLREERADVQRELTLRTNDLSRLESQSSDAQDTAIREAHLAALALRRDASRRRFLLLTQAQQRAEEKKTLWRQRFDIAKNENRNEWVNWLDEAVAARETLQGKEQWESARIGDLRNEISSRTGNVAQDEAPEITQWRDAQIAALHEQIEAYEADLIRLEAHHRLNTKLANEARQAIGGVSVTGWLTVAWNRIVQAWNYELASFDDNPITVGKVILCVLLIFAGYFAAKWASRALEKFVFPRVGVNEKAAAPLRSIAFYALLLTVVLIAFRLVNVPLTVFTVAGGAIAIGVGFGSQNVMNNFISGLILLAERPVRVGDLIELDGTLGTVTHIGARSTKVKTPSNQEIIVPNSHFLENQVVNWTLSDHMVRTNVAVGVAYGSPARRVSELLLKAAKEHEKVLIAPAPFVLFRDFGDSALVFEVHFWIYMNAHAERLQAESEIRFVIDRLLQQEGIVIAFPQRDLHIDTLSPLEVRLRSDEPPASEGN